MIQSKDLKNRARKLLKRFRGDSYAFGLEVINETGIFAKKYGKRALVIANNSDWFRQVLGSIIESLKKRSIELAGGRIFPGSKPNAPREDVYRISSYILHFKPDCLIAIGGGSTIDAVKAANLLASLGEYEPDIDYYFGTGIVTDLLQKTDKALTPMIAVESVSSSGAHLTKYSNITDPILGQKKLIVDDAIVLDSAVFDYIITKSMPKDLTLDGAFDGIAHCLEVFLGISSDKYNISEEIAKVGISLIVENIEKVIFNPRDLEAREALGLATDLGGYSIMVGGTNGAHLTSFSLVDIASHGRSCAIMNPYYIVFFAPAIERQLKVVGEIFTKYGYINGGINKLKGRDLGIKVAEGFINLSKNVGFPTTLSALPGFTDKHIERALAAAKDPQLKMKLRNMPVPLTAALIEKYMRPILESAASGDFSLIKNMI